MGAFVLGILVGWLAEWLFFTFWIKGRSTGKFADCTALKDEVSRKNREISNLQAELESAKKVASEATAAKSTNDSKSESKSNTKALDTSKDKTTSLKVTAKKAPAKKSGSTAKTAPKKQPAKKTSAKKPVVKKVAEKQSVATKTVTKKKPSVKKPSVKKSKTGDDLTKLSGIGPSMNSKLSDLGITSYKKLADMDDDILRDMLEASGARLNNNKEAMDTWNEQAALADKGDFEGLKKLQDSIKS